ncbi:UNVERIFIED_CONTAM: hypothetical protein Sradi_5739400, partial [Sesamum radiatum]
MADKTMNMILELMKDVLPKDNLVPSSFYWARKLPSGIWLGYKNIDACRYDCLLFWKENEHDNFCPVCNEPRWKYNDGKGKWIPIKSMCLSHLADSIAWKDFDIQYPDFARDPCNIKLGLATDAFNPCGNMSNSYNSKRIRSKIFYMGHRRYLVNDHPYRKSKLFDEKNICDSVLGTLLNIEEKTKDTEKAREDLHDLNIRKELHLQKHGSTIVKPKACYTLSPSEKKGLCDFLKSVKFPDGYAANISRCIKDGKISGLKSHDCHVLLQRLISVGIRGYLNKDVTKALFELGEFFRILCSKTLKVEDIEKLERNIPLIL